ncbi:MAG TPA: hypothetical protein VL970_05290, partial [Candidatus Acidoferrales bacterium]|nr:hypothetical protein [Candidatus Acidoferrales bacterium]
MKNFVRILGGGGKLRCFQRRKAYLFRRRVHFFGSSSSTSPDDPQANTYQVVMLTVILMCLALSFTIGCTMNGPYRTDLEQVNTPRSVVETTPEYKLGFVEFDDQGWFQDVKQKASVERMIRKEA